MTPDVEDCGDDAVGSCLRVTHAGGTGPGWRLPPHSTHEIRTAHDERARRTPIQRGQGTLCR